MKSSAERDALREAYIEGAQRGGNMSVGEDIGPHFDRWWERQVFSTALDAGTAEMVRKQLETHVTVPASVKQHCQFDQVTDGGKEEWRAIFKAGLDAYLAAGGAGR